MEMDGEWDVLVEWLSEQDLAGTKQAAGLQ